MRRALVLLVALSVPACASLPAKQRAVTTLQSIESALGSAQDFERANHAALGLDGVAADPTRRLCPPAALPAPLPTGATTHQVVSCLFAQAFASQIATGRALQTWQAGPLPPLADLKGEVDAIFGIASGLPLSSTQQTWLASAQSLVNLAISIFQSLKLPPTAVVPGGAL